MSIRTITALVLLLAFQAGTAADTGVLRVGADIDYPPYSFIGPDGQPQGFDIDFMRLVNRRLNQKTEFVLKPWTEILQSLESGSIDIVVSTLFTISRSERLIFSRPYNRDTISIFAPRTTTLESIGDIDGLRLAILAGDAIPETFLESNGLVVETKQFRTFREALSAVSRGEADFSLIPYGVGMEIIKRENLTDLTSTGPAVSTIQYRLALDPQHTGLRNQIDREIEAIIDSADYNRLQQKWLRYERREISLKSLLRTLSILLIPGVLIILGLWIITLNRQVQRQTRELKAHSAELETLATVDVLTGLVNRRFFEPLADKEFRRARRRGAPLSLLFIDIDHFKVINDTYGHPVGDQILKLFSRRCADTLREYDTLARFGGEEFIAMLPDTALPEAEAIAERIRTTCREGNFSADLTETIPLTVSIGVTVIRQKELSVRDMIARADAALYEAKQTGRDRVVAAPE